MISPRWGLLYIFNYFIYYDFATMGLGLLFSFSIMISPPWGWDFGYNSKYFIPCFALMGWYFLSIGFFLL